MTDQEYEEELFKDQVIEVIEECRFDNCRFINCTLRGAKIRSSKFIECNFEECDLSNLTLELSTINDVQITGCKAIGINFSNCHDPFELNIKDSTINLCSFYDLNMKEAKVTNCIAHDVDFESTNLEKSDFKDSDLKGSMFNATNLKNADFTSAFNYAIDPDTNNIKGLKVKVDEAISFLRFLDIKIVK